MYRRAIHIISRKSCKSLYREFVYGLLALLVIIGGGCTEIYTPELDTGNNILYIEGGIRDASGPYEIKLRYTAGYNDKALFAPATKAYLSLLDGNTQVCEFFELSNGVYQTDSLFQALPGQSYRLLIKTADGHEYESIPQVLPVNNRPIDSVYGLKESRKVKYYNVYGDLIVLKQDVNQIYADIPSSDINTYYRFDSRLSLEHAAGMRAYVGGEPDPVDLYMWNTLFPDDLSVIEVNAQRDHLRKFPLTHAIEDNDSYSEFKYGFYPSIQAKYDQRLRGIVQVELETDSGIIMVDSAIYGIPVEITETDYYYGWIVQIGQYSITQEAYTFWSDVKKLEETEGEIFDPISTQLRGNMICTTDPERPILGIFEVASFRETQAFVNYLPEHGIYPGKYIHELLDFPDRGWQDTIPPDFWVDKVISGNGKAANSFINRVQD